jgi:thiol-disulfide isomerase/thioredoxin
MNPKLFFGIWVCLLAVACPATKAARLGDPAGPLAIKDWVKGKPVQLTGGTNIYVVEFWATWCGPCRTTIPRLSEMQAKFKDKGVIFVGISDEAADVVKPFVAEMGDKMSYNVACDDERMTSIRYMEAFGQQGIPTAFIVGKDRRVLWVGHPLADMEPALEQIVNGTYDLQATMKRDAQRASWNDYQRASMAGEPKATELGKKFLDGIPNELDPLVSFAFGIVANTQNQHRDFSLAMLALDRAEKLTPEKNAVILGVRGITLFESGRRDQGLAMAREAVTLCKDPQRMPMLQNFVRVLEYQMAQAKTGTRPAPSPAPVAPTQRPLVPSNTPPKR